MRLWVSGQTHKELGIHDSCPHSWKKAEQSENLLCWRTDVTEQIDKWCPENWREKQIERITVYQEQKSLESGKGRNTYCSWQAARGSVWTILRVNISWGLSLGLPPHFCEFYLQEPHQVFTVKIMEKSLMLPAGGGEVPILKYTLRGSNHPEICPACSFLHLSSGETSPDPDLPGERGILNSEPSSLPVLLSKGVWGTENHLRSQPKRTGSPK